MKKDFRRFSGKSVLPLCCTSFRGFECSGKNTVQASLYIYRRGYGTFTQFLLRQSTSDCGSMIAFRVSLVSGLFKVLILVLTWRQEQCFRMFREYCWTWKCHKYHKNEQENIKKGWFGFYISHFQGLSYWSSTHSGQGYCNVVWVSRVLRFYLHWIGLDVQQLRVILEFVRLGFFNIICCDVKGHQININPAHKETIIDVVNKIVCKPKGSLVACAFSSKTWK